MSQQRWPGVSAVFILAVASACTSSKSLDRKTAEKLANGLTIDSPAIHIRTGLIKENMHDANAIRAYRRLADAGILRCNKMLTDCRVGARGKNLVGVGDSRIRVTIGYLTIDDISNITQVDDHSAKSDVGLTFKPTPEYLKFYADFKTIMRPSVSDQPESDAVATLLFHRVAKGWAVEDVQGLKKTGTTAWKSSQQQDLPSAPIITNVARLATVTVSSENTDTGQLGINAIDGTVAETPRDVSEWASRGAPDGAWIKLTWPSQVEVWEVVLYDRPHLRHNIRGGLLLFSDGSQINVGTLPNDGAPFRLEFDPRTVTWIQFKVTISTGGNPGLQEFEVFGTKL
jgi:hypothetical protein